MIYREPFVLYLNISVCIILLFLTLPTLLNRKEELKVRLAFSSIFFVVIATCIGNLFSIYADNYRMAYIGYLIFFLSLSFGPIIYYYVKKLLGSEVSKSILFSLIPGILAVGYGIYLAFAEDTTQQVVFKQMKDGEHWFYEITNLLTLVLTLIFGVKSWIFLKKSSKTISADGSPTLRLKLAWAKEFILYISGNVLVFLILVLVLTKAFAVPTMSMDLIGMPIFMLFVYLLIAIRSMMMYKDFEHQLELAKNEKDKLIQVQRLEIARDLHDSLGAQLTFIASVSDGLKRNSEHFDAKTKTKIRNLADFSENSIEELKNALWILNSEDIKLEDLKNKILNFINSAGEAREDIELHFRWEMERNSPLSSKWAVSLFRIVQEIINNSLKYAHAKDIWLSLIQKESMLILKIRDNGIGFDPEKTKSHSFGLSNVKQRVEQMNGYLILESSPGEGTSYFIQFPLQ